VIGRIARVVVAVAVIGAGALAWAGGAGAAEYPDQIGWWWQPQAGLPAGLGVPPPPTVPSDGMYIAQGPTDVVAISALRYSIANFANGLLTLRASPNNSASGAAIEACMAKSAWSPGPNQVWGTRPSVDCSEHPLGAVASDGSTVTWRIPAGYQLDGFDFVDIVLVPVASAAPFQVAFDVPGGEAFLAETNEPEPEPESAPAYDYGTSTDTGTVPGFVPDLVPFPTGELFTSTSPTIGRRTRPAAASEQALPVHARDVDRSDRIVAVTALFAMLGGWLWLGGRPARLPRLLGSIGGGATISRPASNSGIGRFARPRTGRPPKLC
jgi:hypothetical protein